MASPSATHFRCCDCERDFASAEALKQHLNSKVHAKEAELLKCRACKKEFATEKALKHHLASLRHNPLSDFRCLAHGKCKKRFSSPSAQLHHLESGACKSCLTKAKLDAAIAASDKDNIISTGGLHEELLLDDNASFTSGSSGGAPILTPTSSEFAFFGPPSHPSTPTIVSLIDPNLLPMVTFQVHVKEGLQKCPLCPPARTRQYTPEGLRAHIASSVHIQINASPPTPARQSTLQFTPSASPAILPHAQPTETQFHCPASLIDEQKKRKPVKQFSNVSGLAQHLESGACGGGKETLMKVVTLVQKELENLGLGSHKLLK